MTGQIDSVEEVSHPSEQCTSQTATSRIVLIGLFGVGNLGNDGSLEAMVRFLRKEPNAVLSCVSGKPACVEQVFGIESLSIRRIFPADGLSGKLNKLFLKIPGKFVDFVRAIHHVRKADLMIFPGTGILDDFGEKPWGMPYDILKWCLAARLAGTRIAFVSIGAGPIRNRLSRFLMVSAARLAHYRSYRDLQSREFMQSIGFNTRTDAVYPDLAFALPVPVHRPRTPSGPLRVGIGVMAYRGWYGFADGGEQVFALYIGKLAEFVARLLDSGHDIRLLTGDNEDVIAIDAVQAAVRKLRPGAVLAYGQIQSLDDVMEQMALTDVVVATRFHNIVCALKMHRPTISLSYAKKNDVLMAELGLGQFCQHIETFDVDRLTEQFSLLVGDAAIYESGIGKRLDRLVNRLDQQNALLSHMTRKRRYLNAL
jgi:polysaccharide pyruvyl transferase WcaK-like protein